MADKIAFELVSPERVLVSQDADKPRVPVGFGDRSDRFKRQADVVPDGGDGGRGGSIYLVADPQLNTLSSFRRRRRFVAPGGGAGQKRRRHGAAGEDITIGDIIQTVQLVAR